MARRTRGKPKGITPRQAHYLAILQREGGEPYVGNGMTRGDASAAIDHLRKKLGKKPKPAPPHIAAARDATVTDPARAKAIRAAPRANARAAARQAAKDAAPIRAPAPKGRTDEPTATQLHDLEVLARRAGEFVPLPPTRGDAARELARLRSASP